MYKRQDIYEKAEREYKKTGYRLHAGSTPLSELDLERDMDRLNRCADPSREIVQELAEGFYISFLYLSLIHIYGNNCRRRFMTAETVIIACAGYGYPQKILIIIDSLNDCGKCQKRCV